MPKKSEPDTAIAADAAADETNGPPPKSKAALLQGLLRRDEGASLDELVTATGWQPHSARAFLSGLRKKGAEVAKEKVEGVTRYRMAAGE